MRPYPVLHVLQFGNLEFIFCTFGTLEIISALLFAEIIS